jgi:hypothetical protein
MADKPTHVEKFISYSSVQKKRGTWRSILSDRMEGSKYLISNVYDVNPDRVRDIFLNAWDKSTKDYPSPKYSNPETSKEWGLYNDYILYLWEYYVKDTKKRQDPPEDPKEEKEDKPKVEDKKNNKEDEKPGLVKFDKKNQEQQPPESERLYDGVGEEDLIDEEIDERILKILGLEDVFDIDYGTYLTLLKEKMIAARMTGAKMSSEEAELITDEWKRIKGKVGRFRIKKKKVSSEGFGGGPLAVRAGSFFVAQKVAFPEKDEQDSQVTGLESIVKDISIIRKTVESIVELMTQQSKILRKELERDRRREERKKRVNKESLLEKGGKAALSLARKVLSPVQNILDRIIQFISTIILGRILVKLIRWLGNKDNQQKIDSLLRFIGDWWPALLAAFGLFATPLGGLIRAVLGTLTKLTFTMAKKGIPKLLKFIAKNPVTAGLVIGGSLAAGGAYMASQQNEKRREEDKKRDPNVVTPEETTKTGKTPKAPQLYDEYTRQRGIPAFSKGGIVPRRKDGPKIRPASFAPGGLVTKDTGDTIRGAGPDTQLTALQKGEVVISKKAVDKYGANFFLRLNKAGGGTNIPRIANNIQFASGGGLIGDYNLDNNFNMPSLSNLDDPSQMVKGIGSVYKGVLSSLGRLTNAIVSSKNPSSQSSKNNYDSFSPFHKSSLKTPKNNTEKKSNNVAGLFGGRGKKLPIRYGGYFPDGTPRIPLPGEPGYVKKDTRPLMGPSSPHKGTGMGDWWDPTANVKPTKPATIASSATAVAIPPPPSTKFNIIEAAKKESAAKSAPVSLNRNDIDSAFDVNYNSATRMQNIQMYGLVGVV